MKKNIYRFLVKVGCLTGFVVFAGGAGALPVTLVEPADGAVLATLCPELVVNLEKTGDVLTAHGEVSACPEFRTADSFGFLFSMDGLQTNVPTMNLKRATTYYWRARAWHGNDMNNPVYGEYTPVRSFITGDGVGLPGYPQLVSPANGTWGARYRRFMDLSWSEPRAGIVEYMLFKHRQGTEQTVFTRTTKASITVSVEQGEVGYWWVRARNAAGWGPVSGYRHFVIPVWTSEYTQDEPIAGYIPHNTGVDDDTYGAKKPVYRFYSYGAPESTYTHLWTINEAERSALASWPSWQDEGTAWYATVESADGAVPLLRLYEPNIQRHLYTIDQYEYDTLATTSWNGEGAQYYVYPTDSEPGLVPAYRFYHAQNQNHHFTIDETEKNTIINTPEWGYTYEGIGFYVFADGWPH